MIERIIEASARNKFLVFIFTVFAVAGGIYGLMKTPLDAIPDLSDVQVIVYTDWEGRSPDLVEDQITYPISTRFIAAPKVKFVRGESMFGKSFVYVIFEDGTDIYWARSRVIEYLNSVRGSLPEGVNPVIGPDATGVGWVYEYALVDDTGKHDLAELRSLQDWHLRYALESVKGVAEVAPVGGFVKQYQVDLDPNALVAYNIPLADVVSAIKMSNGDVGGKIFEVATTEYYVRGRGYIKKHRGHREHRAQGRERHAGLCEERRHRASRRRPAARRRGAGWQGRSGRRHRRHALRRERAQRHRRHQKEDGGDQSLAARGRAHRADLRPQRTDPQRHPHAARKADRGEHRRRARLHRLPLARPLGAGRDHHAAHRDHPLVPADVCGSGSPRTSCRSAASPSPSARWSMRRSSWWRTRTRRWSISATSTGATRTARSAREVIIDAAKSVGPSALLLAARHHRQLHSGLLAHRAGRPAVQAARLHQDLRDVLRGAARHHRSCRC